MRHFGESNAPTWVREAASWLRRGPILGMACILAATFCFATMNAMIRGLSVSVPPVEIAFFRSLFSLVLQLPVLFFMGVHVLKTSRLKLHGARGTLHALSMMIWFVALSQVPLAEATCLEFAAPIMTTIIAITFLGEQIRIRRMIALVLGIAGVLIVVRPGFEEVSWGQIMILISVALWAFCQLIIRELGRTENSFVQGFYLVLVFVPITGVAALPVWLWPSMRDLGLLFVLAAIATIGTWLYGEAFRRAEMTAILPLESTKLIWAVSYGMIFFSEQPEVLTIIGGVVIFSAAAFITIREAQLARTSGEKVVLHSPNE